jgi:hypothetical protein
LASSAVSSQTLVPATTPSALGRGVAGALIAVVYIAIFLACLLVVSLLEIRQANLVAFNSLVATLEQRDRFADPQNGLDKELDQIKAERTAYSKLLADINCSEPVIATPVTQAKGSAAGASDSQKQKDDGLSWRGRSGRGKPARQRLGGERRRNFVQDRQSTALV